MAVTIIPNEGKDFWNSNALAGRSLYYMLLKGVTVAGGGITALSTRSGLASAEASYTGYARPNFTLGASANGIMIAPALTSAFLTGAATNGPNNCQAYAIVSALSSGVILVAWDFGATFDMSVAGNGINLPSQSVFMGNPGEF